MRALVAVFFAVTISSSAGERLGRAVDGNQPLASRADAGPIDEAAQVTASLVSTINYKDAPDCEAATGVVRQLLGCRCPLGVDCSCSFEFAARPGNECVVHSWWRFAPAGDVAVAHRYTRKRPLVQSISVGSDKKVCGIRVQCLPIVDGTSSAPGSGE